MALHHTVSLQAEGAIEGSAAMYEVASPYETRFLFSRFDATEQLAPTGVEGGPTGAGDRRRVSRVVRCARNLCLSAPKKY